MFEVGQRVKVGEFFWIGEDNHIGFDTDAFHGHGHRDHTGGSVEIGCTVTIRGFEEVKGRNMAVVRLDRPATPYGAPAPIGQLFLIPISVMQKWPELLEKSDAHQERLQGTSCEVWGRKSQRGGSRCLT